MRQRIDDTQDDAMDVDEGEDEDDEERLMALADELDN